MSTLAPEELKRLFLFGSLSDEQLRWLSEQGRVEDHPVGEVVREGEPAEVFLVLLSGTVSVSRRSGQSEVEVNRSDHAGSYMGATQAYLADDQYGRVYTMTVRAITPARFFVLPGEAFGHMIREWFPMAIHLLEGLLFGMRNSQAAINQRERLSALGSLTAGLMHELNNPAAAASRATVALRQRVAGMRMKLGKLAEPPERLIPVPLIHCAFGPRRRFTRRTRKGGGRGEKRDPLLFSASSAPSA